MSHLSRTNRGRVQPWPEGPQEGRFHPELGGDPMERRHGREGTTRWKAGAAALVFALYTAASVCAAPPPRFDTNIAKPALLKKSRPARRFTPKPGRPAAAAAKAMKLVSHKPIMLKSIISTVKVGDSKASVRTIYELRNKSNRKLSVNLTTLGKGVMGVKLLKAPGKTSKRSLLKKMAVPRPKAAIPAGVTAKSLKAVFSRGETKLLQAAAAAKVEGKGGFKSFMYMPNLMVNNLNLMQKVGNYEVTFELPPTARKLVSSSFPPSSVKRTSKGLKVVFRKKNSYPYPIALKWTTQDVDFTIKKKVVKTGKGRYRVTIEVFNRKNKPLRRLLLVDSYPGGEVKPCGSTRLTATNPKDSDPRLEFRKYVDVPPKGKVSVSYEVESLVPRLKIPRTRAMLNGELVGVGKAVRLSTDPTKLFSLPECAFVVPAGWSFRYKHNDHHINEHGMWCVNQRYDKARNLLSWETGCIYADKNFDDDYTWSVSHEILKFDPGFVHHGSTNWINVARGGRGTHDGTWRSPLVKMFDHALVIPRGWRFDYTTGGDHHINQLSFNIITTKVDRRTGVVKWHTSITYADKDYKDGMRFKYWYSILLFNGKLATKSARGTDDGWTMAYKDSYASPDLKNYSHGIVVPLGWNFDFVKGDHHIRENHFKIQNVRYDKHRGKFSWTAMLDFTDKHNKYDYKWSYCVALIATNQGESAVLDKGPYECGGGRDGKRYSMALSRLFTPVTWTNGICDGTETGVDCGGLSPARDFRPCRASVDPGRAASSKYFSLRNPDQLNVVRTFATLALYEYLEDVNAGRRNRGQTPYTFASFYSGPEKPDRYVEAIAWYVDKHMEYVKDESWGHEWHGTQSAYKTLTRSGHRGSKEFAGDCEDFAVLRAALLRSLGFYHKAIFCADHHNSYKTDEWWNETRHNDPNKKKKSGGHTFNIVIYKGKYRILDYGTMYIRHLRDRHGNPIAWDQNVVDNIWNDHTGKHWTKKDVYPYGSRYPLVNYPGNPCSPSSNWDWRTYFGDVTP